ncbi:MAG: DUF4097 family beta strand repeat-containing protein [Blautia sp.]|jgi:hypothetical protein
MEKNKTILMAGLGCVVLGSLILGTSLVLGGTPGFYIDSEGVHSSAENKKHSHEPYVLKKTKLEAFENVELYADYSNVNIIESDGYYLEYKIAGSNTKPFYEVKNDTLTLHERQQKNQVIFFGSGFNSFGFNDNNSYNDYSINLYLPKDAALDSVKIYNDCGDVSVDRLKSQTAKITADYGDIIIQSLTSRNTDLNCENGDMELNKIQSDTMDLDNSYGSITGSSLKGKKAEVLLDYGNFRAEHLDFDELQVNNEYGDVTINKGTLENGKFTLESGSMTAALDGIQALSVKNEYGNVTLQIPEKLEQYQSSLTTEYGEISLSDSTFANSSDTTEYKTAGKTSKTISVYCESGDIKILD